MASPNNSPSKGSTAEKEPFIEGQMKGDELDGPPPKDPYRLVYWIIVLHGIGALMPWNMFISIAPQYYMDYKLVPFNETKPAYAVNFFSYLGFFAQLPNLLLNLMNLFIVVKGSLAPRIVVSLLFVAASVIFTISFIFPETKTWTFGFFILTMASVVVLNSANGIYQNSIYGLVADFPAHFTNAVILGNNVCGIFVTTLLIITTLFASDVEWSAFFYFMIALVIVVGCLVSFLMLPKLGFYRYYTQKGLKSREGANGESEKVTLSLFVGVFKEAWVYMLNVFLVFFVTLAIFPAVLAQTPIYPPEKETDFFISYILKKKIYGLITTFMNFNVFAVIGNFAANYVQWPSPKYLWMVVFPRLFFIPIFLYCNYGGLDRSPSHQVWIENEYVFIILVALMSLSHGYLSSLSMMYAPKAVDQSKARIAGMMSAFFLVLGITTGINFTFIESLIFFKSS